MAGLSISAVTDLSLQSVIFPTPHASNYYTKPSHLPLHFVSIFPLYLNLRLLFISFFPSCSVPYHSHSPLCLSPSLKSSFSSPCSTPADGLARVFKACCRCRLSGMCFWELLYLSKPHSAAGYCGAFLVPPFILRNVLSKRKRTITPITARWGSDECPKERMVSLNTNNNAASFFLFALPLTPLLLFPLSPPILSSLSYSASISSRTCL